jgi:hypothetical protein
MYIFEWQWNESEIEKNSTQPEPHTPQLTITQSALFSLKNNKNENNSPSFSSHKCFSSCPNGDSLRVFVSKNHQYVQRTSALLRRFFASRVHLFPPTHSTHPFTYEAGKNSLILQEWEKFNFIFTTQKSKDLELCDKNAKL